MAAAITRAHAAFPAWSRFPVDARAACETPASAAVAGLSAVQRLTCKSKPGSTGYVAYTAASGRTVLAADGFEQVGDMLETGLRVVSGAMEPPAAVAATGAAPAFSSGLTGLTEATEAAARSPERLRTRGYTRSTEWRFADAETDFRALALQTETGAAMVAPLPGTTSLKPGSATRPFFGVKPEMVDAEGKVVHTQLVDEITTEPDYDSALAAVN